MGKFLMGTAMLNYKEKLRNDVEILK
jgi:hypothetical protein